MPEFQIIVLAAGKGVRMNSELPKVLVPLKGQMLIKRLLENLREFKSREVIVTGHKRDLVEQALGPEYAYAIQETQLGTAHAVLAAKPLIFAPHVVVLYGDMPFIRAESVKKLITGHIQSGSKFSLFTATVPNYNREYEAYNNFGRIIRQSGRLSSIREFKDANAEERGILEVNPGIYAFDSQWLWDNIPLIKQNPHGEYYLTDLLEIAQGQGLDVFVLPIDPREVYGINTPEQLQTAAGMLEG